MLFLLMLSLSALSAASLDQVLSHVSAESISAENYRISYENNLISIQSSELDESVEYAVQFETLPLQGSGEGIDIPSLSFSVTTPDDDTSITLSMPFSASYDGSGSIYHPGIGISHTFDFGRDDEYLEDLQNAASRISTERTYSSSILSIQRSVLELSASIYSAELQADEERRELAELERDKAEDIELGIITPGSVEADEYDISIKLSEDNIASYERQLRIYTESFKALTGLDWEPYDSVPEPSFPSSFLFDGNSEVEEYRVEAEAAREAYLVEYSSQHPQKLSLSLDADGTVSYEDVLSSDGIEVTATAGWESGGWSVYLSGGGSWSREDGGFVPSIAIGGSWRSDTQDRQDELYLDMLSNESLLRQNEYIVALSDYREDMLSIISDITDWQAERERKANDIEYRTAMLERQRILFSRGLAVSDDVSDAEFELEKAERKLEIIKLEGHSLMLSLESLML